MKDEFLNIEDSFKDINNANNLDDLNEQYVDKFATVQQKYRDEHITKLLELYVNFYSDKTKANKKYKTILFYFCLSVISQRNGKPFQSCTLHREAGSENGNPLH